MIIFGTRLYGVKNVVYSHGVCDLCGAYVRQRSYDGRSWGHLYYIPLIPAGGQVRVLRECMDCRMGTHVRAREVDEMLTNVERLMQPCVDAAQRGEHSFTDPESDEAIPSGPFLAEAMEALFLTGRAGHIPGIVELLRSDGAAYEHHVARSAHLDLQGQPEAAESAMRAAADALPRSAYPVVALSAFAARDGQPEQQLELLRRASRLAADRDVGILMEMAGPLEALERHGELTELLDTCIRLAPELGEDRAIATLRKRSAKKAAKQAR